MENNKTNNKQTTEEPLKISAKKQKQLLDTCLQIYQALTHKRNRASIAEQSWLIALENLLGKNK